MIDIIHGFTPEQMNERVQKRLASGWDLYGEPFAFNGKLCQYILDDDADHSYFLIIAVTLEEFISQVKQMEADDWTIWGKPVPFPLGEFLLQWMQKELSDDFYAVVRKAAFVNPLIDAEAGS